MTGSEGTADISGRTVGTDGSIFGPDVLNACGIAEMTHSGPKMMHIDVTAHRLTLRFLGNRSITIITDSPGTYESGNIVHAGGLIVF